MNYYPGIQYFKLAKPMLGYEIGTTVEIATADGRESLRIGSAIEMHINTAKDNPEWFTPVTEDEHKAMCKENTIIYVMNRYSCDRDAAIAMIARFKEQDDQERDVIEQEPGSPDKK